MNLLLVIQEFMNGTTVKRGNGDVANDNRSGCLSTSTTDDHVEQVKKIKLERHDYFGPSQTILSHGLNMKHVAAKFVSRLLNFEQKQRRVNIAQELVNEIKNDPELFQRDHKR